MFSAQDDSCFQQCEGRLAVATGLHLEMKQLGVNLQLLIARIVIYISFARELLKRLSEGDRGESFVGKVTQT